jgi:gliding motility-associated-like protein
VNDEIAPVWESQDYVAETTATCSAIPVVPEMLFTDNCGGNVTVVYEEHTENEDMELHTYDLIRTWTATDLCANVTVVTQIIHVTVAHYFDADNPELCNNDPAYQNFNLTSLLPDDIDASGQWHAAMEQMPDLNALLESLINHQNNTLNVTALPVGYYTLQYVLTSENTNCPITMEYYIHVVDDCGVLACRSLTIYNAVSPNNDSLNDVFYIENITDPCYFENNVKIYNRWGILVYDESGYNNADIAFNGISEGRSTLNKKEELPDGTYFYILKYRDADGWHDKSGYLYLNR